MSQSRPPPREKKNNVSRWIDVSDLVGKSYGRDPNEGIDITIQKRGVWCGVWYREEYRAIIVMKAPDEGDAMVEIGSHVFDTDLDRLCKKIDAEIKTMKPKDSEPSKSTGSHGSNRVRSTSESGEKR